ncbi:efflux RND transporter permease subunit [Marivita sp. S0852]|uniref:efflux RND transporter permease subunit n=1 Tax=Marivita sp. S0852 TaxID=3373893 RepID=UPI003982BC7A
MKRLIRWFLYNRVAANLLMIALIAAGVTSIQNLTVRTFPEIAVNTVSVTVVYPGATPTEVASAILTPIEEELQGLEGVREMTSTATQGTGTVTAELTSGADIRRVKNDIETRVARITTFPDAAQAPRIVEVEPTELAVQIALYGDVPAPTLKALGERVRDDLTDMTGISQVSLSGIPTDQIEVAVTRDTLRAYGIGLTELGQRIESGTLDLSGGTIDTGRTDLQLRTVGEARTAEEYRETIVFAGENGALVRLSDIAEVRDTLAAGDIAATIDGVQALFVSVNRAGSEQVLNIVDQVQAYLDTELKPSLPDQVQAVVWRNSGEQLSGRIDLLVKNGAIGTALILLVLMLFLDIRIAAWVATGVIIAFIAAFAPMLVYGTTINQLSLFGFILALGIVVDDAIVVGESVYSQIESGSDTPAEDGIMTVWKPILFSVTTTILAFVPLLFLPGASGSFITPVAAVVIYVLALSLVESFLILPRHLQSVKARDPHKWSPRRLQEPVRKRVADMLERFADGPLRRVVRGCILHPLVAIIGAFAIALAVAGLFTGGVVKFTFFPQIEGNFVTAELSFPEGTSDTATLERATELSAAARRVGEELGGAELLQNTAINIGFSPGSGGPGGGGLAAGNRATVSAKLLDASTREVSAGAFRNAWRDEVGEIPGARELVFSSSLIGVGAPILLEVSAENEENRDAAVGELRAALEGRAGVQDIRDDRTSAAQEIAIRLKPAAESYGVPLQTLASEVRGAFYGVTIDQIARDQEEVDVRLRLVEDQRDSVTDLLALRIQTADGPVPLTVLADVALEPAPIEIERIGGRTVTTLTADVDTSQTTGGAETTWLMQDIVPQLERDYPGLTVSTGGEQEEAGRFGSSIAMNFSLALLAIYTVLALAFSSYLRPLIVLGIVPFGLIGAIMGHAILGLDLTLLSMFGIIGLSGVVVNGALMIVTFIQQREHGGAAPFEAIEEATLARFRPVLLTTLTTFLGISPLILEPSVQAQFLVPTAVSLGFGILFVLVIQMILVPAYASLFSRGEQRVRGERQMA